MTHLPNAFPLSPAPYKLAIIGEAPGPHELAQGRPFAGPSSGLLSNALQNASVLMSNCFRGYVYNQVPPGGDIEQINKSDHEFINSLDLLKSDLNKFQPNCVLLLGSTALWAAGVYHKINVFRGTIFSGFTGRHKCVSTYSPGYIQKVWDDSPLFLFDVQRAINESKTANLDLPQRTLNPSTTAAECISKLNAITPGTLVLSLIHI